ncbi:MAG TPA: RNA-binding S4 domain-containing protein, partial [Burkholderiales bacterium]|nr:RNA-binding S4 domain-containing protein [Burkholderiales bacterium]
EGGKVKLNEERTKPAKGLAVGDRLTIHIGDYEWIVTVRELSDRRGPATVARTLYDESDESRARRAEQIERRKAFGHPGSDRAGRPTKRERRQLERWRGEKQD